MADSAHTANVTQQTFDRLVIEQSQRVPVLVDFWAAWCGPCQSLMPVLAKLAQEYGGKFFLAKVDTDQEQALAGKHGIRGLPTVKIFRNGAVVNEFSGVQPEKTIRALIDRYVARESDTQLEQALRSEAEGNRAEAVDLLTQARKTDPANDRVKLHLGRMLIAEGKLDDGETALRELSLAGRAEPEAAAVLAQLEFARIVAGAPPIPALEQQVKTNDNDMNARYQLAAREVMERRYDAALANFLEIVRRNRKFNDDAGRKAMLALFNLLGNQNELVKRYRGLLSMALN